MRGSLKLFTMFSIPVHLHWSFGLIILYAMYIGYSNGLSIFSTLWLIIFILALFGCVLLHEFGHSLTARRFGVPTQDIILTPIGGIARLERMPEKPKQEFLVAIAGPMVNVGIAILLVLLGRLIFYDDNWEMFKWLLRGQFTGAGTEGSDIMEESGLLPSGLLFYMPALVATNIALVVFNLIPAFPMDGGRVLRALLAMRMGRPRATRLAALIGQGIAVLFVGIGLWQSQFTLTLIGFFVFTTARAENAMVQTDALLQSSAARDLIRTQFSKITINDWMQTPLALFQQGLERNFLVFDLDDNIVGVLKEKSLAEANQKRDLSTEVSRYMSTDIELVHAGEPMRYLYYLLVQKKLGIVGVVDDGHLLGVIDELGLQHFLNINKGKARS